MSITYTITTNFGAKDTLPTGDSGKIVKGTEFTTEFQAIKTAFTLAAPTASPTFTGTAGFNAISIGGTAITSTPAELNVLDGITATTAELNILDGVTATTAELNILDGVTATTTELNYVDGVTSNVQTQLDTKAPTASPTFTGTVTVPVAVFNGSIEEEVSELTGTEIDPANGTTQYKTLIAATTFTESLTSGEYVTLMIDDGTGDYGITWPSITWLTSDGNAPALQNTGYTVIELFKVSAILYGAVVNAA